MNEKRLYQTPGTKPRFFYGYIIVVAAFFTMVLSWATYSSFGIFFNPLVSEFGWNRAAISGAFSLSMFIYGVLGIVVGELNDRFGPRVVITVCGLLMGVGYFLLSRVSTIWQLYLFLGVIVGVGMSGVWVPQLSTIARWFIKRRTLMSGIVVAGVSIGQLAGSPVVSRLIVAHGWSASYIILGIATLVVVVLAAQLMRREPAQMGQSPYGETGATPQAAKPVSGAFSFKEAVHTAQFWILFVILFCFGFASFSILVHIVPHAIDLKVSPVSAANLLAVRGGLGILGSNLLGAVADRIGNKRVFIMGFVITAAALLWLSLSEEIWVLYLCIVIMGFASGGMGASESPITAWLFGLGSHGLIYGVVHVGFTVGAAAGPFLTGYLYDLTGSYQEAFLVCAALGVIGLVFTVLLRPTRRLSAQS